MIDSPIVAAFIRSALVPGFLAAAACFAVGGMKDPMRARLQGLIIAVAFFAGSYLLLGRVNFPPHDVAETFGWAGLVLGLFVCVMPKALGPRYLVRALVVLAIGAVIFWPLRATILQPVNYRNLVAFFCLSLGVWSILERASGTVKISTLILLPLIAATALSFFLLFSASASLSQLVTVLCAILGGLLLIGLFFPGRLAKWALIPFVSSLIVTMMAAGHFYLSGVNPWHMIYLCIPFLVLWIRSWLTFVPESIWAEALILGLLAAAPLVYFIYNKGVAAGPLY